MKEIAILSATNHPQPDQGEGNRVKLGCGFPEGESAPKSGTIPRAAPLTRAEAARLLLEREARDTLTDRQIAVAATWSKGASVTSIAAGIGCKRQAASSSLRLALCKLSRFAEAIGKG